ncbi:Crm [Mactra antiquata]
MPPRKRRQSAQGEETVKESEERVLSSPGIESEVGKVTKPTSKASDKVGVVHEKTSTPKQLKQDTSGEVGSSTVASTKNKESTAQSMPTAESNVKQPTRFSTRIVKRPRRDLSPPESPVKKGKKVNVQPVVTTPETKGKRQWELWSVEDKDSFFEGLCEYGKDFESIHTLIVNKCKKKGNVLPITVKNKEQVRHFYYRTWHKISKLIEPVEYLKKDIQELYGLISYSVLRKKLRGGVNTSDKNWQKLNDLVHQGVATIKVKGKRIRVKTPACNALKKLNNVEETRREPGPKVPEKIRVEFRPKTNLAWQQVQDVSHNPRVRLTVRSDRHLQSLVKYLEQKWKPQRLKLRENLGNYDVSRHEFRVFPHRNSTLQTITMEQVDEPTLHFGLNKHKECNLSPSNAKKKKDKDQCIGGKNSAENIVDISKSVISELNCLCKETCNSCAFKEMKNCGFSIDLMKSCAGKNGTLDCSCTCNIDKNTSPEMDKNSDKAAGVGGATSVNGQKEPPARSLFGTSVEVNDVKSPSDFNDSRCVLRQKDSPLCRTDEVSSALPFARSLSGQEVSAIADGENAMFPDSIAKTSADVLDEGTASDGDVKEEEANSDDGLELDDDFTPAEPSRTDFEKMFKTMMDTGWSVKESDKVTLAELYLMFGEEGEMKFEYEWINHKTDVDLLHEKLLNNLNNMLRRLSHLATIEFTDLKTPGTSSVCQSCGLSPNGKKTQNKGKDKSPPGTVKITKHCKEVSTQTQAILNPIQIGPGISTSSQNGVFRIPVLPPPVASTPKTTTTTVQPSKELLARYNATTTTTQKQLMRPRKIKHTSRQRPGTAGSLVQRTILPKNSEYITIIPMVPGTQIPNHSPDKGQVETIVGHPINGIQKQPVSVPASSTRNPILPASPTVTLSSHTPEPTNMVEMSLSPDGDQTLLRIPASHLSTMSKEALKAAGFSTMPGTPVKSSVSMVTTDESSNVSITTTTTTCKPSSPPNLSLLLDMSLPSGDIENDTTFNSLLDDNNKTLTVDPVLTTPPIRSNIDTQKTTSMNSPPVRSLFRSSPTPDSQQWLGSDVTELSLSSFLESPSKQSSSTPAIFNPNMPISLFNENSREFTSHRIDVDTTFQSMMNESSIDYMKKFADLAEQITQQDTNIDQTKKLV